MGLLNNKQSEFDLYIAEQEQLIGVMRVSISRSFGDGYDCGVGDTTIHFQKEINQLKNEVSQLENEMNQLENERELLDEINQEQERKLTGVTSLVGKALRKCR